jgi:hypothetical protein
MKLKLDDAGHVVVSDGKPVFVHDDGKEVAFDVPATLATISRLNGEAKGHRERAEAAEGKLVAFKAIATVKNLDDKKLVDAGEVEKVKAEAIKAVEEKYRPVVEEVAKLKGDLYGEKIGGSFARSKFIADKIAIPPDMLQARFGQNFEVKDGRIVAKDSNGNPIYSRAKPGELADFDEAIETLVDQYPQKDHILKGTGNQGDGKRPNTSTSTSGTKTMLRAEFNKLDPSAQMKAMTVDHIQVVDAA